jgi:hypothetical protein
MAFGFFVRSQLSFPSPLWGGVRGGGDAASQNVTTPLPNPPPQGGREQASIRRTHLGNFSEMEKA